MKARLPGSYKNQNVSYYCMKKLNRFKKKPQTRIKWNSSLHKSTGAHNSIVSKIKQMGQEISLVGQRTHRAQEEKEIVCFLETRSGFAGI